MKKWIFVSILIVTGFFTTTLICIDSVKAAEYDINPIGNKIGLQDGRSDEEDPVVTNDSLEDGVDNSIVQPEITKVPDNFFSPLGAGEWDYIGSSTFRSKSGLFSSGGGDLGIAIEQPYIGPGFTWMYELWEDDPFPGYDDLISRFTLDNEGGTYELVFDVRGKIDGSNNRAEVYLKKLTVPQTSVTTHWYD